MKKGKSIILSSVKSICVHLWNKEIEFSGGFTDLHTASYQSIINGKGYGLTDALPSVNIVKQIRDTLVENVIA